MTITETSVDQIKLIGLEKTEEILKTFQIERQDVEEHLQYDASSISILLPLKWHLTKDTKTF